MLNRIESILLAFFATYPQSGLHRFIGPASRFLFASLQHTDHNTTATICVSKVALLLRHFFMKPVVII